MHWWLAQYNSPYSPDYIMRLESKTDNYETIFYMLLLICVLLFAFTIYQYIKIHKLNILEKDRKPDQYPYEFDNLSEPKPIPSKLFDSNKIDSKNEDKLSLEYPTQKDLPDPGLIYKYVLYGITSEKIITIGQKEGTIKTFSTEIVDNHLKINIQPIEKFSPDLNLPGKKFVEKYIIDFKRGSKVTYSLPGSNHFKLMGAQLQVIIKNKIDKKSGSSVNSLDSHQPIRFRLGARIDSDGRFKQGYFEFHFYTKPRSIDSNSSLVYEEKDFFLKLYKIFPGYDTASQNEDGLFAMIDRFSKR